MNVHFEDPTRSDIVIDEPLARERHLIVEHLYLELAQLLSYGIEAQGILEPENAELALAPFENIMTNMCLEGLNPLTNIFNSAIYTFFVLDYIFVVHWIQALFKSSGCLAQTMYGLSST